MPCYDYLCPKCGQQIEVNKRMMENPIIECPDCGCRMDIKIAPVPSRMSWKVPLHNKDLFNPDPQGYVRGNVREV